MFDPKKKTDNADLVTISYNPIYNVCVEYYGDNDDIIRFFSILDIWGSRGEYESSGYLSKEDQWTKSSKWRFELSKDILPYFKEELPFLLSRRSIEVQFLN